MDVIGLLSNSMEKSSEKKTAKICDNLFYLTKVYTDHFPEIVEMLYFSK